jgi:carboxymethylenebutenolidase
LADKLFYAAHNFFIFSYQIAKNNLGVKASIIYYGFFNPKDDLSKMRATILGHFGKNDRAIKVDTVYEFQANLKTLSGDHEVYIYENAGHAFANPGDRYVKAAAELAWNRTVVFLDKYL